MRILADENMPRQAIALLREAGHDVRWVVETDLSAPDINLLELANREERTLITYDTDFGELIHKAGMTSANGIILFRIHNDVPDEVKGTFIAGSVMAWNHWPPGIWTVQIRHHPSYPE